MVLLTKEQKNTDVAKIKLWLEKFIPGDVDRIDVAAEHDSTLTLSENKEHFREMLGGVLKTLKEQADECKASEEKLEHDRIVEAEREARDWNKKLVYDDKKELDTYYDQVHNAVKKVIGGYSNLLFVKGQAGIGKSSNIRKALVKNKADFIELCGDVTEAYLYRLIFENNGKVIWLKEVANLLTGNNSINLLKSATETEEKRVLTKSNYSKVQSDLPDTFVCKCKFIFDYNNLPRTPLRDDFEALISRGQFIELAFCEDEIKNILSIIAKDGWEKEVTDYLVNNYKSNGLYRLNLRTQHRAFKTYQFAIDKGIDWKQELETEFKNNNKVRALIYSLIGNKVIKTAELKKLMLKFEIVNTLRTADNHVNKWLLTEELYPHSVDGKNILVGLNPHPIITYGQ